MLVVGRLPLLVAPVVVVVAFVLLPAACGTKPQGAKTDAGFDVPAEHFVDAVAEAVRDGATDVAPDMASDVAPDASVDAPPNPFAGYGWVPLGAPLGAPIVSLAFDSEGMLYAGAGGDPIFWESPHAGIFKSTDDGASWRAASLGLVDYVVAGLAAAGTTTYAGTGQLMRSIDRGAGWQPTTALSFGGFRNVSARGSVVVASAPEANVHYVSTDAGSTFHRFTAPPGGFFRIEALAGGSVIVGSGDRGVFRSTDMGATFAAVQGISNGLAMPARLRCDGVQTCYATAFIAPSGSNDSVFLASRDAGATWTVLRPQGRVTDVLAISDTGRVYVRTSELDPQIARSDDGGSTLIPVVWPTATTSGAACEGVFIARGGKLFAGCSDGVHRSDDMGQHWQPASGSPVTGAITGAARQIFADTTATALGPNGDIYVEGPDGVDDRKQPIHTLKRSSDGGGTWQTVVPSFASGACIVTPGGALECQSVSVAGPGVAVARSADHGVTWRDVGAAVAAFTAAPVLGADGTSVYAAGRDGVLRSTDDGATFQLIAGSPFAHSLQVLNNGHLLVNGTNSDTGYRSTDRGATWQSIAGLVPLPVAEDATGRLIRYTFAGHLEVSTDEAVTWTILPSEGLPRQRGVIVPPVVDGAGRMFLIGAGPDPDGPLRIFASADAGATFLPMPAQIPNPNALSFAVDKQGRLLAGTAGGCFRLEPPAPRL